MKKIITSGFPYTDIDVLACAVAYQQLLKLEGHDAEAILSGPMNLSISKSIREKVSFKSELSYPLNECEFIIVDLSVPEYYSKFVIEERVIEVFDHRFFNPNLEGLRKKLKDKCHVEAVGSCSTLIFEEFSKRGYKDKITPLNALLIYTAIVSNTLDLKADVTTKRDIDALHELKRIGNIDERWKNEYYEEIEEEILKDPLHYMSIDTKSVELRSGRCTIAQIELFNSEKFFNEHGKIIHDYLKSQNTPLGFVTSPSIGDGVNYIYALNLESEDALKLIWPDIKFENRIARTDKLYLRKEILSKLLAL